MYPAIPGTYFETTPSDVRGMLADILHECDKDIRVEVSRHPYLSSFDAWRGNCNLGTLFFRKNIMWTTSLGGGPLPGPAALQTLVKRMRDDPYDYVRMTSLDTNITIEILEDEITVLVDTELAMSTTYLPFCRQIVKGLLDLLT